MTTSLASPSTASNTSGPLSIAMPALALAVLALAGLKDHAVWTSVLLLVIAPLLEEVVFRAGVQEALLQRRIHSLTSTVGTAMAFAFMHGLTRSWLLAAWVFLPALVLGAVYASKRSLAPVVVLHSAMNLAWLWTHPAWTGLSPTTSS